MVTSRAYQPKDAYYRKAKEQGLRARSAFKLEEIARKHRLFRRGATVLDLGAAPGGFLKIIADAIGPGGYVLGVDRVSIEPLGMPNVATLVLDVEDASASKAIATLLSKRRPEVIVSDMAPKTTGISVTDEARSIRLVEAALALTLELGKPKATFLAKLFMGAGFEELRRELQRHFAAVRVLRPKATRSASREVYLLATEMRGP